MSDRCVCCGEIIPEGRQVCPSCEKQTKKRQISDDLLEERDDHDSDEE